MKTVFINGQYSDANAATISVFDRGSLFGDAIYEVIPAYKGRAVFVDRHLARLKSNLEKIKIDLPHYDWQAVIQQLLADHGDEEAQIYIQVTRGNQGMRKHDIPKHNTPTVVAFTLNNHYPNTLEKATGLRAKLVEDTRWARCDIKTTSLLANVLLNDEAVSAGYHTAILVRNGFITEGSTSNIFIVTAEELIKTPPLTATCLPGITRQLTIELIAQLDVTFKEEEITEKELLQAKEVWITSTTKEIMPVTSINEVSINQGTIGVYWKLVNQMYLDLLG